MENLKMIVISRNILYMTVDRLLQIKQTISELPIKITSMMKQTLEYDIYLISNGFRPGTYFADDGFMFSQHKDKTFENTTFVEHVKGIFKGLQKIPNISVYVGPLQANSTQADVIYIFNTQFFYKDSIKWLEEDARTRKNPIASEERYQHIARLQGHEKINYLNIAKDGIYTSFIISNVKVFSYYTTKMKLPALYDRFKKMQKILDPIGKTAKIVLNDTP